MAYVNFWALASVAAVSLVPADRRAKAMSVVAGGISVAMIVGVPAGTLLAQYTGWQAAFWAVAAMTALSVAALLFALPGGHDTDAPPLRLRTELRSLAVPRLWAAYATAALTIAATIAVFSYLGALLEDVTGVAEGLVPLILALYGVGALTGMTVGGRVADRGPIGSLLTGMGTVAVAASGVALTAGSAWAVVPLAILMGAGGMFCTPAVNARVFGILGETRTLGGAINIAAFNVGIAVAPYISGLVIDAGLGLAAIGWVGAAFALAAVESTLLDRHLTRRHQRGTTRIAAAAVPDAAQAATARR
ncbi:MFS transporter [Streptomyces sp. ME19-01-6]|uniref:MFS transporter n=1 Tax=Streptomyces sp. ME19-01-6 TaxID=3028686 RepID=UPI0029AE7777|nr:MFS transporter [Streptomyces sp. ME19-01-6]MDX3227601.1 MFS transporter [Streptomyces sp. ME19-01-6]